MTKNKERFEIEVIVIDYISNKRQTLSLSFIHFGLIALFRYLDRLKELPPALKTEKFEGLLPFAELARFNKKELKRYRYIMQLKWDRYAQELAFAEDHPDFVKKIEDKTVEKVLNFVERMQKKGASMAKIRASLGVSNNSR